MDDPILERLKQRETKILHDHCYDGHEYSRCTFIVKIDFYVQGLINVLSCISVAGRGQTILVALI